LRRTIAARVDEMRARCSVDGAAPTTDTRIEQLLDINRVALQRQAEATTRAEHAEARTETYRRLIDEANADIVALRRRIVDLEAALSRAEHPAEAPVEQAIPERPSNVVPIAPVSPYVGGNGSAPGVLFDSSDPSGRRRGLP
jgi:hypothetical protein